MYCHTYCFIRKLHTVKAQIILSFYCINLFGNIVWNKTRLFYILVTRSLNLWDLKIGYLLCYLLVQISLLKCMKHQKAPFFKTISGVDTQTPHQKMCPPNTKIVLTPIDCPDCQFLLSNAQSFNVNNISFPDYWTDTSFRFLCMLREGAWFDSKR